MKRLLARLLCSGLDGRLEAFKLEPGDRILYTTPANLNAETAEAHARMLKRAFPGHDPIVVCGGGELAVIREPLGDQAKEQIQRMGL